MAFFDNEKFLISHIRHSFISCDDTGMCEAVMAGENLGNYGIMDTDGVDMDLSQSYDIVSDMDIGAHRHRSNTAVRLERLKKEKKNQVKTKNIQWTNNFNPHCTEEEVSDMFNKKELKSRPTVQKKSLLAEQLEFEYAKFDGKVHSGVPTKKIKIFLTMADASIRDYPMEVVILATAKVQDLIGLICWHYVDQKKTPELKERINCYSLHIAEDDGEVDWDFPCLDPKDTISKFGFSVLALVEKKNTVVEDNSITISVNIPNDGNLKIKLESSEVTAKQLVDKVMNIRGFTKNKSQDFCLEKSSTSTILDQNAIISSQNCTNFTLVNSADKKDTEKSEEWALKNMIAMEAPLYRSFTVHMFQKLRTKAEVHLGISGEKIEIDPLQQKSNKFWNRQLKQKSVSYDIDMVAACELVEVKYGKAIFRFILQTGDNEFKFNDFETDRTTANHIIEKMLHILEMRSSTVRCDYLASTAQERKPSRRQFFPGPR
ncbi:Target of rapamycin complex 2 subunit MAPKAP1 [Nymphon striatum]|nr:Target of rapamycin complex 2 subunit MAPKAP1 [Nymphon striatum]